MTHYRRRDTKEVLASTKDIITNVEDLQDDHLKDQLIKTLERFEHTNPSATHNSALPRHQDDTNAWVLESTQWMQWLMQANPSRLLWIHGIPGVGNTVLASFLIEQMQPYVECPGPLRFGFAYYYCLFSHNQDETGPFLRWIITQLCRQACRVPTQLQNIVWSGRESSTAHLLLLLEKVLAEFDVVVIIIDALDESLPREQLLIQIRTLATNNRFHKLRVCATSREYNDITLTLSDESISLPMSTEAVQKDIERHVQAVLSAVRPFKNWPEFLSEEVKWGLLNGAKGM